MSLIYCIVAAVGRTFPFLQQSLRSGPLMNLQEAHDRRLHDALYQRRVRFTGVRGCLLERQARHVPALLKINCARQMKRCCIG